jgi:2-succinyl-6-hydroxy-2,4-cyclohexadiene-1-carboxylate synthase
MTRMAMRDDTIYEVRSAGYGPAVLLLHGFTGRGTDWAPFLRSIHKSGHRSVVIDLLGHGRSAAPADPSRHAIERQAEDVAAIVRRLRLEPVIVVGYSMGARVALRLAATEPHLVRGLVLESPSAGITDRRERTTRAAADAKLADQLDREGLDAFLETWESLPIFATEQRLAPAVVARIHAARQRNRPHGLSASLRGAGQGVMEPLVDRLRTIACPTLVIVGGLDPTGIDRARAVAGRIPTVRMVIMPDRGHAPHRESPARFRRILIDQLTAWRPA